MFVDPEVNQWCDRLRGSGRPEALLVLSTLDRPCVTVGEKILLELMKASDTVAFESVCRSVGRAWAPTGAHFNKTVATRVMEGQHEWLKTLLENHLTQVEYAHGPSSRPPRGTWLHLLIDMVPSYGWNPIIGALNNIPFLWAGGFGKELSKSWQDPDAIPKEAAQLLRRVEAQEVARRRWIDLRDISKPALCPSHWQRSETTLTGYLIGVAQAMENGKGPLAVSACREMVCGVEQALRMGADPAALHDGDPALLLLSRIEFFAHGDWASAGERQEMMQSISRAFEKMANAMQVSLPIRSSDSSLSTETLAMVFADSMAPHCAQLSIVHGCPDQARDRDGHTWKMRAILACCLDSKALVAEDFSTRNYKGESLLHLFLKPRSSWAPWMSLPNNEAVGLLQSLVDGGLSMDEADGAGNTARSYALANEEDLPRRFLAHIDAQLLTRNSHTAVLRSSMRRI